MRSPSAGRIKLAPTQRFYKDLARLPDRLQTRVWDKLQLFVENPTHPSLRVKKMRGRERIWELSVTREYRITFEWREDAESDVERVAILRRVGTHDVLKRP